MELHYQQLSLFLDSINEAAKKSTEKIMNEADEFKSAELEKAKKAAQAAAWDYIKTESEKLKAQVNRKVSESNHSLRRQLAEKRIEISESVFRSVTERLSAFTDTDDYKAFLLRSVEKMADYFKENEFILFVREKDLIYKDILIASKKTLIRVEADDEILLGGCKGRCGSGRAELDDTLDTRLEDEKQWFYENSNLAV